MPIRIQRVGELYAAVVTPPHGRGEPWSTPAALPLQELVERLEELGCHQTDIGDALFEADPLWQERTQAGGRGVSLERSSQRGEPGEINQNRDE